MYRVGIGLLFMTVSLHGMEQNLCYLLESVSEKTWPEYKQVQDTYKPFLRYMIVQESNKQVQYFKETNAVIKRCINDSASVELYITSLANALEFLFYYLSLAEAKLGACIVAVALLDTPTARAWLKDKMRIERIFYLKIHEILRLCLDDYSLDWLEIFVRAGIDLNIHDTFGSTILMHAAEKGNVNMVLNLLKYDAHPHIHDSIGNTALSRANEAKKKNLEHLRMLACSTSDGLAEQARIVVDYQKIINILDT